MTDFCHLRVYSEYSLKISINRIDDIVAASLNDPGTSAVALSDLDHVYAAVKFYKKAIAHKIKPILGSDIAIKHADGTMGRVIVLCKTWQGFQALSALLTKSELSDEKCVHFDWFDEKNSKDLLILSGGWQADWMSDALSDEQKKSLVQRWKSLFADRYYLEIHRLGLEEDESNIEKTLAMAEAVALPIVATNPICFMKPEDHDAHQARECINQGRLLSEGQTTIAEACYFKSAESMVEAFKDFPDAIKNTVYISQRCACILPLNKINLPVFEKKPESEVAKLLVARSESGLQARVKDITQEYKERLIFELDIIKKMGFSSYFLIVADFIQWAKEQGIPVGPGRGSGAGSMIAYVLGITDLDPIIHGLLFERFLNPERVSMPDFDIDFCMDRRDQVIEYVAKHYGRDHVAQIITFGTMAAKAVVRDVGRVLGLPYGMVDGLAKLIPFELGITLDKAIEQEPQLQARINQEPEVSNLFSLARKLEGVARNVGKHAGGVVIAPKAIEHFMPIYQDPTSQQPVTQFDKDDVEAMGLVKFDFLGLRTLTIIDWTIQTLKKVDSSLVNLDINTIPLDDKKTFEYLQTTASTAIFQLESRGMQELVFKLQPDRFEDLVALVALYRPGPLQSGMVDDFVDRKHGRSKITYLHDSLAPILDDTYGVILYQEQVMNIAQDLAGYTLGSADLLRRAMGKKKPEEMAKQRVNFVAGASHKNIPEKISGALFDLIEKFAGYGFNKSHSAAYALLTYQTAWLKAHHPAAFMSSVLSADLDNTDKLMMLLEDCKRNELNVLPPCVQHSSARFTVQDDKTIRYGLAAIKGVGIAVADFIEQEQSKSQFLDLADFCFRLHKRVSRKVLEALTNAGAFDCWNIERAQVFLSIEKALSMADQRAQTQAQGQQDLFGMGDASIVSGFEYVKSTGWSDTKRLKQEKESLGFYFSGHPIDRYREELAPYSVSQIQEKGSSNRIFTVAGYMSSIRVLTGKKGGRFAFMQLEGLGGRCDCAFFNDTYDQFSTSLNKEHVLIVKGKVSFDDYTQQPRIEVAQVMDLAQFRTEERALLAIHINQNISESALVQFKSVLEAHSGYCPIYLHVDFDGKNTKMTLPHKVKPSEELCDALLNLDPVQEVSVVHPERVS